jgi:hypothetical protein
MRYACVAAAVIATIALIAMIASPAFAQSQRRAYQRAPQAASPGVYASPRRNTDPDPNVQFEIMRQQNWRKGG